MSRFARRVVLAAAGFSPVVTGLVKPTAANSGVPTGTSLTVINGDLTISTAGQIVSGKDVRGFVYITASNVTFQNSIVRGRSPSGNGALVNVNAGANITLNRLTIAPTTPSVYLDGIWGDNYTATGLDISGTVDGLKIGSNCTLEKSYVHDMTYYASDPNQGGGPTHNDCVQMLSGDSVTLYGNCLNLGMNGGSAVQITQDYGAVTNVVIEHNWMDGGGCSLNIAHKVLSSLSGILVKDNVFGRNSGFNCPILISTQTTIINTNNTYEDDGQIVPIQQHD